MKPAFTLIEILTATMMMGILMVVSIQSMSYMNQIHQQNEIRYLALNRLDSEMSRLVMAYKNHTSIFTDTDVEGQTVYKLSNGEEAIENDDFGLKISSDTNKRNFVQLKDIGTDFNKVEDGDFIGILNWETNTSGQDKNISLRITYPYIYHTDTNFPQLWDYTETLNLKTSTRTP